MQDFADIWRNWRYSKFLFLGVSVVLRTIVHILQFVTTSVAKIVAKDLFDIFLSSSGCTIVLCGNYFDLFAFFRNVWFKVLAKPNFVAGKFDYSACWMLANVGKLQWLALTTFGLMIGFNVSKRVDFSVKCIIGLSDFWNNLKGFPLFL